MHLRVADRRRVLGSYPSWNKDEYLQVMDTPSWRSSRKHFDDGGCDLDVKQQRAKHPVYDIQA